VQRRINECDGLIAFLTRRDAADDEVVARTHRWVQDEFMLALAAGIRVVEVRESGVDDQGGFAGNRQRIA
jgi:hypothetical protein